jgi:hypothetical protein
MPDMAMDNTLLMSRLRSVSRRTLAGGDEPNIGAKPRIVAALLGSG